MKVTGSQRVSTDIRRISLVAAVLFPAGAAGAEGAFVMIGDQGVMAQSFVGCQKLEDLNRMRELAAEGDTAAASRFAVSRGCSVVREGTIGRVQDVSAWSNASCLRQAGSYTCSWVPLQMVVEKP